MKRRYEHGAYALLALVLGVCAGACASSPFGGVPADGGANDALFACSGPGTLHAESIPAFVAKLSHAKFRYTPLTIDASNAVMEATRALDDGDSSAAASAAPRASYTLSPLMAAGECYWVLQPMQVGSAQQATLIYAARWQRDLVIEAPHVPEDHHTDAEAAQLLVRVHAKAAIIAGAHRCSVTTPSNCRPSTECNQAGTAVTSDPAHSTDNALNAMHLALKDTTDAILQLHTNLHPELNGDALVSNGTHFIIAGTPAEAFFQALRTPELAVRSCNDPSNMWAGAFCGETNTQGLASNGAADTCLGRASSKGGAAAHRFIHLEQSTWRICLASNEDPACLDVVDRWTERIGAALARAVPISR